MHLLNCLLLLTPLLAEGLEECDSTNEKCQKGSGNNDAQKYSEEANVNSAYKAMFDTEGKFKRIDLEKDAEEEELDFIDVEGSEAQEETEETAKYTIRLESKYEEGITGVHLMNKYQQKYAMDEFVAGTGFEKFASQFIWS